MHLDSYTARIAFGSGTRFYDVFPGVFPSIWSISSEARWRNAVASSVAFIRFFSVYRNIGRTGW